MHEDRFILRISDNPTTERNIDKVYKFLSVVARPPKGSFAEETEWLRRDHKGPLVSIPDICSATGASVCDVELALQALNAVDLLAQDETPDGMTYALKRYWSRLFLDIEQHGWAQVGETLRMVIAAGNAYVGTTSSLGRWELHERPSVLNYPMTTAFG